MSNKKQSGLDIDLGNLCSKDAFGWAKKTFANRQGKAGGAALQVDGAFSNMHAFGKQRIGIASDGIGTKIELAERTHIYNTLGYDLVAMVADDLATAGFEPTNISNIIDVNHLDRDTINELMRGLTAACNFANISISGGEIAELGNRIGGYGDGMNFNWCSTAIGVLPEELEAPFDGTAVEEGQVVLAIQSRGFRSNGFSLIRRIMQTTFGDDWHGQMYDKSTSWGQILLTPSLIYTPLITQLIKSKIKLTGVAHITGGGIADNFARVLKASGCGATLSNIHAPLPVMKDVMALGDIAPKDAYLYWNMGNGMLLVADPSAVNDIQDLASEMNYQVKEAGHITNEQKIVLRTPTVTLEHNT